MNIELLDGAAVLICGRRGSVKRLVRRREAFTLVELLVVLAVVAILMALLLPTIQKMRESSFRAQCSGNLRQIGIAFHTHHAEHGFFPSGGNAADDPPTYAVDSTPLVGAEQQAGWGFQILPYIEGANAWNGGTATDLPTKQKLAQVTPNGVFFCDARRGPMVINGKAMCDYAASNLKGSGVVRKNYCVRVSEITDGTASTLLVGDKSLQPDLLGMAQADDQYGYAAGWGQETVRSTNQPPNLDHFGQPAANQRFGSLHPTKFQALFADDSVHSISYSIDPQVFRYLGSIADGNTLEASEDW